MLQHFLLTYCLQVFPYFWLKETPISLAGIINSACLFQDLIVMDFLKSDAHEYDMIHRAQMSLMFSQLLWCSA